MNGFGRYLDYPVIKEGKKYYIEDEGQRIPLEGEDLQEKKQFKAFIYKDHGHKLKATTKEPKITLGEIRPLRVVSATKIGAFVDIGLERDVLCPFTEQVYPLKEGTIQLFYLYVDKSDRLALTTKIKDHLKGNKDLQVGDSVTGVVYHHKKDLGYFVAVNYMYDGLIPNKEAKGVYVIGEEVKARVIFTHEDGKLTLTTKDSVKNRLEKDSQTLLTLLKRKKGILEIGDKSSPEKIYAETKLSKKAFKRAAGRLYKNRMVEISDYSIKLLKK